MIIALSKNIIIIDEVILHSLSVKQIENKFIQRIKIYIINLDFLLIL